MDVFKKILQFLKKSSRFFSQRKQLSLFKQYFANLPKEKVKTKDDLFFEVKSEVCVIWVAVVGGGNLHLVRLLCLTWTDTFVLQPEHPLPLRRYLYPCQLDLTFDAFQALSNKCTRIDTKFIEDRNL